MRREFFGWWSERLQMEMPIVRYGHYGPALLLFPTWQSDFMEAEQRGLIGAIAHHIDAGRLTVFCINSITPHSWCNDAVPLPEKSNRTAAYSGYVEHEVVPYIRGALQTPDARIAAGGASFGAFFAANAVFRRPDLFSVLIGMSGFYKLDHLLRGYSDENLYFNSPAWFLAQLPEGEQLHRIRADTHLHLLSGRGAHEAPQETEEFSRLLHLRGVPHHLSMWGHEWPHDWQTWHRMLDVVLSERLR